MKLNCHVGERYPSHRKHLAVAQELTRKEIVAGLIRTAFYWDKAQEPA